VAAATAFRLKPEATQLIEAGSHAVIEAGSYAVD
jgi:hypothetical protein